MIQMEVAGFTETSVSIYQTSQSRILHRSQGSAKFILNTPEGHTPGAKIARAGKVCTVEPNALNMEII
jgi:hypothetical protein